MAADLTGMFAQLNKAIQGHPMAGPQGKELVAQFSQGLGKMGQGATSFGAPQNTVPAYSFQTEEAKKLQAADDLGKADLNTSKGMAEAAKIYQHLGEVEKAVLAANKAKEMQEKEAKNVTENAQKKSMLDIVAADSSITETDRQYYNTAITNGTIKTREDYLNAKRGLTSGDLSILKGGMIEDSQGNIFNTITVTDENTGLPTTRYSVVGEGPAEPVGKVTPISPTTGLSGEDTHENRMDFAKYQSYLRMDEAELDDMLKRGRIDYQTYNDVKKAKQLAGIEREENWVTEKEAIVMNLPNIRIAQGSTQKMLDLLDTTGTGGINASIARVSDFFGGIDTSDTALLNAHMGQYVLDNLRKMGANPTEGERAFLIDMAANISRGNEANVALFEKALKRLELNAQVAEYLLDNPGTSREDYVRTYNKMIEEQSGRKVIKLGDLE